MMKEAFDSSHVTPVILQLLRQVVIIVPQNDDAWQNCRKWPGSYRKERTGHIELFVVIVQLVNTADWL
jgi:hypothetical protein